MSAVPSDVVQRPRGRPRSEVSKRAILAATVELLAEVGFEALSIDAVAERAGVSKATIYRWWRNKVAVVGGALDEIAGGAVPEPDTGSLDGDVRAALEDLRAVIRSPVGRVVEAVAAAARYNPELYEALEQHLLSHQRAMVRRVLSRAQARGELRAGVDTAVVADVVVTMLFFRVRLLPPEEDLSLVEAFVQLVAEGVRS